LLFPYSRSLFLNFQFWFVRQLKEYKPSSCGTEVLRAGKSIGLEQSMLASEGGLGIKDIRRFNAALVAKWK